MRRFQELLDTVVDWEWEYEPDIESAEDSATATIFVLPDEIDPDLTVGDILDADPEDFGDQSPVTDPDEIDTDIDVHDPSSPVVRETPVYAAAFDVTIDTLRYPGPANTPDRMLVHVFFRTDIYVKGFEGQSKEPVPKLVGYTLANINIGQGAASKAFAGVVQVVEDFLKRVKEHDIEVDAVLFTGKGNRRASLYSILTKRIARKSPNFEPFVLENISELLVAMKAKVDETVPVRERQSYIDAFWNSLKYLAETSLPSDLSSNDNIHLFALLNM